MSIREEFPGDRGGEATQDVASFLAAITLPSIEPFGSGTESLVGLPWRVPVPVPDPEPLSVAGVARAVYDEGMQALGVLKCLEDAVSACKASLVARVVGAAGVEAHAMALDPWQRGVMEAWTSTELGMVLGIPERTAAALAHHSAVLVGSHPRILDGVRGGVFSFRHATLMLDEFATLNEHGGIGVAEAGEFEDRLLRVAVNTTVAAFASKARRTRESMFPGSMVTRTKEAFRKRSMTCDPGKDGMSWLTLFLPTVTAEGIYTRCTRLARAMKAEANQAQRDADRVGAGEDCREYRTLAQLRADIAAILLLGEQLPATTEGAHVAGRFGQGSPSNLSRGVGDSGDSTSDGFSASGAQGQGSGSGGGVARFNGLRLIGEEPSWAHTSQPATPRTRPSSNTAPTGNATVRTSSARTRSASDAEGGDSAATDFAAAASTNTSAATSADPSTGAEAGAVLGDEVLMGELVGDGSGYIDNVVDGIREDPQGEYMAQLEALSHSKVITDPPVPKALILLNVPVLGLLGITDEPAELVGPLAGPVPESIARRLLGSSTTFLRVLTDPISGEALPAQPQRYTLKDAEKAVLQALAGHCYVPNCPNPVIDTDLDHLEAYEFGGASSMANLRPACKRHHAMKHFKDDKNRYGQRRCIKEPERNSIRLRGWTPKPTSDGRIGWTTPSGRYQPPPADDTPRPRYPKWLKKIITPQPKENP